jgi:hypothetical protein
MPRRPFVRVVGADQPRDRTGEEAWWSIDDALQSEGAEAIELPNFGTRAEKRI